MNITICSKKYSICIRKGLSNFRKYNMAYKNLATILLGLTLTAGYSAESSCGKDAIKTVGATVAAGVACGGTSGLGCAAAGVGAAVTAHDAYNSCGPKIKEAYQAAKDSVPSARDSTGGEYRAGGYKSGRGDGGQR